MHDGRGGVLIHAAPANAKIEIIDAEDRVVSRADLEREGDYSPSPGRARRPGDATSEVWPDAGFHGLPVLLAGGEVGILRAWQHAQDRSWWQWSIEFSNHVGRPDDWAPPAESRTGDHRRGEPGEAIPGRPGS